MPRLTKPTKEMRALRARATAEATAPQDTPKDRIRAIVEAARKEEILDLVTSNTDLSYQRIADLYVQKFGSDVSPHTIREIVETQLDRAVQRLENKAETLRQRRVAEFDIIRDQALQMHAATITQENGFPDPRWLDLARKCTEDASKLETVRKVEQGDGVQRIELVIGGLPLAGVLGDGNTVTVTPEPVDG